MKDTRRHGLKMGSGAEEEAVRYMRLKYGHKKDILLEI